VSLVLLTWLEKEPHGMPHVSINKKNSYFKKKKSLSLTHTHVIETIHDETKENLLAFDFILFLY
jgi:hypothetical protein